MAALGAGIAAQEKRIVQLTSTYRSDLQRDLADIQARVAQLQPSLDLSNYRAGLMELHAPQAGVIKDLATTTVGAVVQPGAVVMTLVPQDEALYTDVSVKNEDVGFTHVGQQVRLKLLAYPFQRYGLLAGEVVRLSLDATDNGSNIRSSVQAGVSVQGTDNPAAAARRPCTARGSGLAARTCAARTAPGCSWPPACRWQPKSTRAGARCWSTCWRRFRKPCRKRHGNDKERP